MQLGVTWPGAGATAMRRDPKSILGKDLSVEERAELLVIGAGPAGLRPRSRRPGRGSRWCWSTRTRSPSRRWAATCRCITGRAWAALARNRNAMMEAFVASEPLIETAFEAGVDVRLGTACWGLYANGAARGLAAGPGRRPGRRERSWLLRADHVIVGGGPARHGPRLPRLGEARRDGRDGRRVAGDALRRARRRAAS